MILSIKTKNQAAYPGKGFVTKSIQKTDDRLPPCRQRRSKISKNILGAPARSHSVTGAGIFKVSDSLIGISCKLFGQDAQGRGF